MIRVHACAVADCPPGGAVLVPVEPPIAVFNVEGSFLATDDTCTHDKSSLADGYISGDEVECAWHFARFCLRSGAALTLPAVTPLETFTVEVVDSDVFVVMPADRAATLARK